MLRSAFSAGSMAGNIRSDSQSGEARAEGQDDHHLLEACLSLVDAPSLTQLHHRLDYWLVQLSAPRSWTAIWGADESDDPPVEMHGKASSGSDRAAEEALPVTFPLQMGSRVVGKLELTFEAHRRPTIDEMSRLFQLARGLSRGLARLHLEMQSLGRTAELCCIRSLLRGPASIMRDPGLDVLAATMLEHVRVTSLQVLIRQPRSGRMVWGTSSQRTNLLSLDNLWRLVQVSLDQGGKESYSYMLARSSQLRTLEQDYDLPFLTPLQSLLVVPIRCDGMLCGAIIASEERNWQRQPISGQAISLCVALARLMARSFSQSPIMGELIERARFMQALIDSLDNAVLTVTGGYISSWNKAAHDLFGYSAEEVVGRSLVEVLPGSPQELLDISIMQDSADAAKCSFEWKMQATGGRDLSLLCRATRLDNLPAGTITVMCVFTEVGRERELEYLKDELLSSVSHELRTPLNGIYGFGRLLLERPHMSEAMRREALQSLQASTERLTRMADDLIDVARARRQRLPLELDAVDITHVVRSAVREIKQRHPKHKIGLRIQKTLPAVRADSLRVKQIIDNLCSNAAKYSAEGTRISLYVRRRGAMIAISVSDEGAGMPQAVQDRIFEPFYRADTAYAQRTSGAGLGLSIVKSLVEAHEGQVSVRSVVGTGTTFTFTLPVIASHVQPDHEAVSC